ncbi:MAG: nitroreductase family protein [Bacteroidales bacterium]|nr:nitroreductase family protein [Bacteroidales bacterium]MBE6246841.1 nitroreductase family protein [Bacteroidales bacterium]
MADNYLEKKFEELHARKGGTKHKVAASNPSLDSLLLRNRSYRGFDNSYKVSREELVKIVEVCTKTPCAKNQQALRFKLVYGEDAPRMHQYTKWGGALPELNLPFKGTEPTAFIIICSTVAENKWVDIDLGIAAQSMLLKAVELGLNGICIGAFNKVETVNEFALEHEPLLVLAIGKGAENIQLTRIKPGEQQAYYRKDGVHFVPKLGVDDILL